MINTNDSQYQEEQGDFFDDKCPNCMAYLDKKGNCTNWGCFEDLPF